MLLVLLGLLSAAAGVRAQDPFPAVSGMDNAFGSIRAAPYVRSAGEPVELHVEVFLRNGTWRGGQAVLFGLDSHSPYAPAQLVSLTDWRGEPLPLIEDQRASSTSQPKVLVAGRAVHVAEPITLTMRVTPLENGKFHVGVLVLALDHFWQPQRLPDGETAQLYAYTLVGVRGMDAPGSAPPFVGAGNGLGAAGPLITFGLLVAMVAAVGLVIGLARWLELAGAPRTRAP
jgi:hypothetical protein